MSDEDHSRVYGAQDFPRAEYGESPSVQKTLENRVVAGIILGLSSVTTTDLLRQSPASVVALSDNPHHRRCKSASHIALRNIPFGGSRGGVDAASYLA